LVAPTAGAVVLVRFPFSDLSQTKLRPALVLADAGRGDAILCQITNNPYGDVAAIELGEASFASGSLRITSYARPAKLFTANQSLITSRVGAVTPGALQNIVEAITKILNAGKILCVAGRTGAFQPPAHKDAPRLKAGVRLGETRCMPLTARLYYKYEDGRIRT